MDEIILDMMLHWCSLLDQFGADVARDVDWFMNSLEFAIGGAATHKQQFRLITLICFVRMSNVRNFLSHFSQPNIPSLRLKSCPWTSVRCFRISFPWCTMTIKLYNTAIFNIMILFYIYKKSPVQWQYLMAAICIFDFMNIDHQSVTFCSLKYILQPCSGHLNFLYSVPWSIFMCRISVFLK